MSLPGWCQRHSGATNVIHFVLFQLGWFACVLGAADGLPWIGPAVVLGLTALHLATFESVALELRFLALVTLLGVGVGTLEQSLGWLEFEPEARAFPILCPLWIGALWLLFGTAFHRSLRWMAQRSFTWAAVFGAVGSPLSYAAGVRLGAVRFPNGFWWTAPRLGALWAAAMIVAAVLSRRWDPLRSGPLSRASARG